MQETPCFITLPFEEIIALRGLAQNYERDKAEMSRLKAQVEGLRATQSELMMKFSVLLRASRGD